MTQAFDGVYDRTKPWVADTRTAYPPQAYIGPFASNMERVVSQSIAAATMTAQEIQEYVRPPLPQVELFPQKYGYHVDEVGIRDIVRLRGRAQEQRVESDFSQTPNTAQSTSRNTLGQV
jgi:hypothetical protein